MIPVEAPPGEEDAWPAAHQRLALGFTASQIVSRTVVASAGVATSLQRGTLENPYRRALVRATLFPESVPRARDRYTAFAGLSWSVARALALHARHGTYWDSWGVSALVPEASVVAEVTRRGLLSLRYRFYAQRAASFYEPRYDAVAPTMTGDPRLGPVHAHGPALDATWRLVGTPWSRRYLALRAGYELSVVTYEALGPRVVHGQIATLGVSAGF